MSIDTATATPRVWSPSQLRIFDWFEHPDRYLDPLTGQPQHLLARARAGCLAGDTVLNINRAGKGSPMTIEKVVGQFNGVPPLVYRSDLDCYQRMRPWQPSIETRIARADADRVRLGVLAGAWCSGVKTTYTVTTETGRSIRATDEHPFLLENGQWAELGALVVGSRVSVNVGQGGTERARKMQYRQTDTNFHPNQIPNGRDRWKVATHRLIVEAEMNALSFDEYVNILRTDEARTRSLQFLPETSIVHHKDGDELNNSVDNLLVLCEVADHAEHHDWGANVLARIGAETVVSVERYGEEPTYDVSVQDDPHCFLANGFVVHNTGKTTTIAEGLDRAPEARILASSFNKIITAELAKKVTNPNADVKTLHSLGLSVVRRWWERIHVDENNRRAASLAQEVCTDAAPDPMKRLVAKLMTIGREIAPHARKLGDLTDLAYEFDLVPDEEWEAAGFDLAYVERRALDAMELAAIRKPVATGVDYADMLYLPVRNKWMVPIYGLVVVDEAQDMTATQLELARGVCKGRIAIVGDDRQCQPAGTLVRRSDGSETPIEALQAGDTLITYDRGGSTFIRSGVITEIAQREYDGNLYSITAGAHTSRCTDSHKWMVRWTNRTKEAWATYLMRQGKRYRVGQCRLFRALDSSTGGLNFGIGDRARVERADAAWVLAVHTTKADALAYEQIVATRYGLPEMCFYQSSGIKHFTQAVIDKVYEALGDLSDKAKKCLFDHGRSIAYPIYVNLPDEPQQRRGRATIFETQACNLIAGYMAVVVAPDDPSPDLRPAWMEIERMTRAPWHGTVYSLDVATHHKYIADGLVTCNSIYAFRGADATSLDRLKGELHAVEMPLTTTYRCATSIVAEAKKIVPDFEAGPDNAAGSVSSLPSLDALIDAAGANDFVLSRTNAPLAKVAMAFIRQQKRVRIQGRDIGAGLRALTKKIATGRAANSIPEFLTKLKVWEQREVDRALKAGRDERIEGIRDKAETLRVITEGVSGLRELDARLDTLFSDTGNHGTIVCSSVHKAKGLEADRVFVLRDTLYPRPPKDKPYTAARALEEANLHYVAITRAQNSLVYVSGK